MAAITGRRQFGLYTNGQAQDGTDTNFSAYNYTNSDALSGDGCFAVDYNVYGSSLLGDEYIPVDTSKYYIHTVSVKTYQRSYNNRLGSGHLGFACYDKNKSFIDLRNCGDVDNAYLTRTASPGDTSIFVDRAWFGGDTATQMVYQFQRGYFRQILFFPPTHPDYGQAHRYTRFNNRSVWSITPTGQGDWEYKLSSYNSSGYLYTASSLPDYGYALPAGTPISRGVAGGSYNYAHGAPIYPEEWTTYTTPPFTGENRNSAYPFRYGTKYIRFLNLRNYNYRSEQGGNSARYYVDNIMLTQVKPPSPVQEALGFNYRAEFDDSSKRVQLGSVKRFKRARRGGQKKDDFF